MALSLPPLGIGTYPWGGRVGERIETDRGLAVSALKEALSIGYRLIDTAEVYGSGLAEEFVGEAISTVPREELFIVSKVWKENLSSAGVHQAVKGSLKRLKTDYLDLYLIHWPSDTVSLSETIPAMVELVNEGLVRAIGVSNFSVVQLKEAGLYLNGVPLAVNQIEYNILHQSADTEIIPYCQEKEIKIMTSRPLAKGSLVDSNDKIKILAKKYNKTTVQVALNWIISQGHVPIPKASSKIHLEENWGALGWSLSPDDIAFLKAR